MVLCFGAAAFLALCLPLSLFAEEAKMEPKLTSVAHGTAEATTESATVESEATPDNEGDKAKSGYEKEARFGGPNSVGSQLKTDDKVKEHLFKLEDLQHAFKPYYDFKRRVNQKIGLQFGGDYNMLIQDASRSLGEDTAAGGVFRFYGHWKLLGRDSKNTGTLVYKVENRHRLGTDIAPQQLAGEIGYAGLTAQTFSNAGWELTNFFWQQELLEGRLMFGAGVVDVTDYVDTYGFVNPWTDFSNLAFLTDPTIPAPNQGLGAAVLATFTDNIYVLAGLADANGDPTDPWEGFHTFFGDHEFFKHMELGWYASWKNRIENNIHLTGWQADARENSNIPSGWGVAFSFNHIVADQWLPFARLGYSDGGAGTILERSVSIGVGRYMRQKNDVLGIGLNWGRPSEETFGPGLRDQYTAELYYRCHLLPHLTITPDVQLVVNPALNPTDDQIWVFGFRARIDF